MGKYKYRYGHGLAFMEKKDLKMMEEMAQKGYTPVGVTPLGFFRFVPCEPEEVSFAMDVTADPIAPEDVAGYLEIFAAGGWQHVFSLGLIHFFKAPKGTTPIYTDRPSEAYKHQGMTVISARMVLLFAPLALLAFFLLRATSIRPLKFLLAVVSGGCGGVALAMGWGIFLNWLRARRTK